MKRAIILLLASFLLFGCAINTNKMIEKACLAGSCFNVDIADTGIERERGLMFVEKMDMDRGMLFVFENEGVYPFWMKNTLIPLDMIWIDSNKRVVFIAHNVQPCRNDTCPTMSPDKSAMYVLEINDGLADRLGIKEGDWLVTK